MMKPLNQSYQSMKSLTASQLLLVKKTLKGYIRKHSRAAPTQHLAPQRNPECSNGHFNTLDYQVGSLFNCFREHGVGSCVVGSCVVAWLFVVAFRIKL